MTSDNSIQRSVYDPDIASRIISRLTNANLPFTANDNIAVFLEPHERDELLVDVQNKVADLLRSLIIDTKNDPNTQESAYRIAKMFINETLRGRYELPPKITTFPNTKHLDE